MLVIVQSPYWFTIGRRGVFSLGGWTPHVQPGFHETESTLGLAVFRLQGFHLLWPGIPAGSFGNSVYPRSLAATDGIAVAFFSCAYLDVSVLHVRSTTPIHSGLSIPCGMGCPIRTPSDHSLFTSSPKLFAGYHVLHRLSTPRHPPCALTLDRTNRTPRTDPSVSLRTFPLRPPARDKLNGFVGRISTNLTLMALITRSSNLATSVALHGRSATLLRSTLPIPRKRRKTGRKERSRRRFVSGCQRCRRALGLPSSRHPADIWLWIFSKRMLQVAGGV